MATRRAGKLTMTRMHVASIDQVKTGIRRRVMPGVRWPAIVASTQMASSSPAAVARTTPKIHRYIPSPGALVEFERGSKAVQPALPGPLLVNQPRYMVIPPPTPSHQARRARRGRAISAAPTCRGTRYTPMASDSGTRNR